MKTFTKILTAMAATALLATGCVNEDPAYKNNEPGTPPDPNAKGYLTLADMSMRVVVDTDDFPLTDGQQQALHRYMIAYYTTLGDLTDPSTDRKSVV